MITTILPILSPEHSGRRHAQVVPGPGSIDSSFTSRAGTGRRVVDGRRCGASVHRVPARDVALESAPLRVTRFPLPAVALAPEQSRAAVRAPGMPGLRTADAAGPFDRSGAAYALTHGMTVAGEPSRPIIVPIPEAPRKAMPAMQRSSDPQLLAAALDEVLPLVVDKLDADGERDAGDEHIIRTLRAVSDGQLRHAEIFDLTASINRIGLTKRNRQKVRELFPELAG
jgi:hypothetical protein